MAQHYLAYAAAMAAFEDYNSSELAINSGIKLVRASLATPLSTDSRAHEPQYTVAAEAASRAFEFWVTAFGRATNATSREDIKVLTREYLCTAHAHSVSPYNIAQGIMKATIHCLWRKLYTITVNRGHPEPESAIRDAVTPVKQRAVEYFQLLYGEIAAENGETVDEMMRRVCGDD